MRLLNASLDKAKFPTIPATLKLDYIKYRGKHFILNTGSLLAVQVADENEVKYILADPPKDHPISVGMEPNFQLLLPTSIRTIVLNVTHKCDLKCRYCFVSEYYGDGAQMSVETAITSLDRLLPTGVPTGRGISVGFFGGEPFLNQKVMEAVAYYMRGRLSPAKPRLSVTTNGTMINEKNIDWILNNLTSAIVSMEGVEEIHNHYRPMQNGNSFQATMRGLELLKGNPICNAITLRSTYTAEDDTIVSRLESLNELCDRGYAASVSVEPVYLSESSCIDRSMRITEADLESLGKIFEEAADWYVARIKLGKTPRFHHFNKMIERILYRVASPSECLIGDTKIPLLNNTEVSIKDLPTDKDFWVYSCASEGKIVPGKARSLGVTRKNAELVEVTLDNNETIKCTPDHKFMMRDGTYKEAKDLKSGDSGGLGVHKKYRHPINHKVLSVKVLDQRDDVYDITVDTYHNFALSAGVFVHNCGAGNAYIGISPLGVLTSCHRENFTDIGHISYGFDEAKRAKWRDNRLYARKNCMDCSFKWLCGGGCRQDSLCQSGDITLPDEIRCRITNLIVKSSLWIICELGPEVLANYIKDPNEKKTA